MMILVMYFFLASSPKGNAMLVRKQNVQSYHRLNRKSRIWCMPASSAAKYPEREIDSRNDGWINNILLGRNGSDSLFQSANMVVGHFLSTTNQTSFPLRRLQRADMSNQLFEPLFGECDNQFTDNTSAMNDKPICMKSNRKRINLKLTVAYKGKDFCGWEDQRHHLYRKQPHSTVEQLSEQNQMPSVQGTLVDVLDPVFGKMASSATQQQHQMNHTSIKREKSLPLEIKVAGRTDAGVSAIAQICRIRTWRTDLPNEHPINEIESYVQDLVNNHAGNLGLGLRITKVQKVGDDFHPTFGAACRAYAYLIDLQHEESIESLMTTAIVPKLDGMLRCLEGRSLDYVAFSYGKVKTQTTVCTLIHARASLVECTASKKHTICIELVGDRFLRRMVRILVATALREACKEVEDSHALLNILEARDRAQAAFPAPPDGLIFVGAGYS